MHSSAKWWILGLGNPGTRYAPTRHNLGFRVVDALARRVGVVLPEETLAGDASWCGVRSARVGGEPVGLAKPMTYMNRSGIAAKSILEDAAGTPDRMLVVYDDVDLALGTLRLRPHGGSGGHNGIRSLIDHLQTDRFPRLRLGIRGERISGPGGPSGMSLADYVLEPFEGSEMSVVDALIELAASAAESVVSDGLPNAMNRWNGRKATTESKHNQEELDRPSSPKGKGAAANIRSNGNDGISG